MEVQAQKSVLLVDDEQSVREALARLFALERFRVVTAANTSEALRRAEDTPVDIVVLDVNIGGESGWELVDQLTVRHPHLPVIAISARPGFGQRSHTAGVTAFMEKPLNLSLLLEKLRTLTAQPKPRPQGSFEAQ